MDKVVVSDTNIFIDLIDMGLVAAFFECGLEIHTTAMVVDEVKNEHQRKQLLSYPSLVVRKYKESDYETVYEYYVHTKRFSNLSVTDCSVLLYAKELGCTLLTNDGKLRNVAKKEKVEVKRLLSIIMYLVDSGKVKIDVAKSAMEKLMESNNRAPVELIVEYIKELEEKMYGYPYNKKYPPNKTLYPVYGGYETPEEEAFFNDFAVLGYDIKFQYRGVQYYCLYEPDHTALCDSHFSEEYQVFSDGNDLIEHLILEGKTLISVIHELENVEPV